MFNKLWKLFKNTIVYGTQDVLEMAIGFFLIPVYTAFLSPDEYGIISLMTLLISVLTTLYLTGQHGAAVRFYHQYRDLIEEQKKYFGSILIFLLVIPLFFSFLLILWGNTLFDIVFKEVAFLPYGMLAVVTAYFAVVTRLQKSFWIASESTQKYVGFAVGKFLLSMLLIIFFVVFLKWGAYGKLLGGVIAGGIFWLIAVFLLFRFIIVNISVKNLKDSLDYGLPLIPHMLAGTILTLSDRYMLEIFTDLTQVGLYSLGYKLGSIALFMTAAFDKAWSPFFFTFADRKDAKNLFPKVATYIFCFSIFLTFLLSLFAEEIVIVLADPKYYEAYKVIPIVALGVLLKCFYFIPVKAIFYHKKTKIIPLLTGLAALVNIGLNLLFIPLYGIIGAAWATVGGYLVMLITVVLISQRLFYIKYEVSRLLKGLLVIVSTYSFSLIFSYTSLVNDSFLLSILFKMLLVVISILVLYLLGFFDKREIGKMKEILFKRKIG